MKFYKGTALHKKPHLISGEGYLLRFIPEDEYLERCVKLEVEPISSHVTINDVKYYMIDQCHSKNLTHRAENLFKNTTITVDKRAECMRDREASYLGCLFQDNEQINESLEKSLYTISTKKQLVPTLFETSKKLENLRLETANKSAEAAGLVVMTPDQKIYKKYQI